LSRAHRDAVFVLSDDERIEQAMRMPDARDPAAS
jgi:hypothetical protein